MHYHTMIIAVLIYLKINGITCDGDITYIDLRNLESNDDQYDYIHSRNLDDRYKFIDIYTNYPDVENVLESYNSLPKPWMPTSHTIKFHQPEEKPVNEDFVYIQSQKNVDEHDLGDSIRRNDYDYSNRFDNSRPKFKTSKYTNSEEAKEKYVYPLLSHIQKIPKQSPRKQLNHVQETQRNINEILKKYIAKLYAQRRNNTRKNNRKVAVDVVKNVEVPGQKPISQKYIRGPHNSKFLEDPLSALKNKTMKFANKFLSLFTVIEFPNSRCVANSASSEYEGTCYHQTECDNLNGTAIGQCANGYGVCCVCKYVLHVGH